MACMPKPGHGRMLGRPFLRHSGGGDGIGHIAGGTGERWTEAGDGASHPLQRCKIDYSSSGAPWISSGWRKLLPVKRRIVARSRRRSTVGTAWLSEGKKLDQRAKPTFAVNNDRALTMSCGNEAVEVIGMSKYRKQKLHFASKGRKSPPAGSQCQLRSLDSST